MRNRKIFMVVVGTLLTSIGCGFLQFADLGIDPYNAFVRGITNLVGVDFGLVSIFMAGGCLVFALVFDKHYIGLTTVFHMFFLGYIVQYTMVFLSILLPVLSLPLHVIILAVGLIMISIGCSLYITADWGVSPYDSIALIVSDKTFFSFRVFRVMIDFTCVMLGLAFSATIGVGTILTAFFLGPAIDLLNRKVSKPFLEGKMSGKVLDVEEGIEV